MFSWVNRGAKGIALIDAERDWPVLHYVFDVSDVHPAKRIGKKPYLWKLETEHEEAVLEQMEKTYGETEGSLSRCGADMEIWAEELNFEYIRDFNTPKIHDFY